MTRRLLDLIAELIRGSLLILIAPHCRALILSEVIKVFQGDLSGQLRPVLQGFADVLG
jgi:hypothetical protein